MTELLHHLPPAVSGLFSNAWGLLMVVLFFGGSIFFHELGHFLAARWRGLHVERFSIGFDLGRPLWSWRGRDGVDYRVGWLPLGGYVMLPQLADLGMIEGRSEVDAAKLPPVSYRSKMIVFAAGPAFNVLFAFLLACVLWVTGQPKSSDLSTTRIGYVVPELEGTHQPSPALEAGLRAGDDVRAVDGHRVRDWNDLLELLISSAGREADGRPRTVFTVERDGRALDLVVHPQLAGDRAGDGRVRKVGIVGDYEIDVAQVAAGSLAARAGFAKDDVLLRAGGEPVRNELVLGKYLESRWNQAVPVAVRRGAAELTLTLPPRADARSGADVGLGVAPAVRMAHVSPFTQIGDQIAASVRMLSSLLNPRSDVGLSNGVAGPIGIARIFHSAARVGLTAVFMFTVVVNISLAVFNLLPIPVLDGGQMLFATVARIRGRALPFNLIASMQLASIALVLSLILYLTYSDAKHWYRDAQAERADAAAKP